MSNTILMYFMERESKVLPIIIILMILLVALSGCLNGEEEVNDENGNDIPAYIPHTENANISLSIVNVYSTDSLSGTDGEGNEFTIYAKEYQVFTIVLLNVTNTRIQDSIQTEERQFEVYDNKGEDRSITKDVFIDDPHSNQSYRTHNFDFTNVSNYMEIPDISPEETVKLAAVSMAPPNSIRTVVLAFKIWIMGDFQPFQKVSIDVSG